MWHKLPAATAPVLSIHNAPQAHRLHPPLTRRAQSRKRQSRLSASRGKTRARCCASAAASHAKRRALRWRTSATHGRRCWGLGPHERQGGGSATGIKRRAKAAGRQRAGERLQQHRCCCTPDSHAALACSRHMNAWCPATSRTADQPHHLQQHVGRALDFCEARRRLRAGVHIGVHLQRSMVAR